MLNKKPLYLILMASFVACGLLTIGVSATQAAFVEETHAGQADDFYESSNKANLWDSLKEDLELSHETDNPEVQKQITWYQHHQTYLNHAIKRAAPYIFYVYQQTQKQHLPAELALLPFIESNYNLSAASEVGATGLWQIMPGTARESGLKINSQYDGRRSLTASTRAALNYLSSLHRYLNKDWLLALAAYNSGQGTLLQAIKQNTSEDQDTDFWSLPLPQQTRTYVPKLLAIAAIIHQPERYHIHLQPVNNTPYLSSVTIVEKTDFNQAARIVGISTATLRQLNPAFRQWPLIAANGPMNLVIPINKAAQFKRTLAQLPLQHQERLPAHI